MSQDQQQPTSQDFDALRTELAGITRRLAALEKTGAGSLTTAASNNGDPGDAFAKSLHEQLRAGMAQNGSPFGLGIVNMVLQANTKGGGGTAFSIVTLDGLTDVNSENEIPEKIARVAALTADPLVLRVLRRFYVLRFEGKAPHATAAELAAVFSVDTARIEELLQPLVENQTVQRGLALDGTPFYQFDGNNHLVATLLFRG